jgi:pyruvate formate lyase activating enzyme
MADRSFYEDSGGGVTLSGGEPVLQHEFARAILERCKAEGIHTAIETAGNYPWEHAEKLLPFVDLVMMDIKHMDPDAHRRATGVTNKRVLENARRFALSGKPVIFRTPVIPTVNDTVNEIAAIAAFVRQLTEDALRATGKNGGGPEAHISYELLAFHKLAADKYRSLDMDYNAVDHDPPTSEHMETLREAARGQGVAVR